MKITYDKTVDVLNVTLRVGRVTKTVEVAPKVMWGGLTHTPPAEDGSAPLVRGDTEHRLDSDTEKRYYFGMTSPIPQLTFTAQIFKEGKQYVSFNPELRVASCGATSLKAKENLKDAIRGFMLSAHKKVTLSDILEEAK